jgi:Protein of unknown function (DUF664)
VPGARHHGDRVRAAASWAGSSPLPGFGAIWDHGGMPWTAPEIAWEDAGPLVDDERAILEDRLAFHRATLLRKCAGLTGEQLARRAAPPSALSLLGLIRHAAKAERLWFRQRVGGEKLPRLYPAGEADIHAAAAATAEADYAILITELEACRTVTARASLDDVFTVEEWGRRVSVRWVYVHMIEEYARHNGHADLLREHIDQVTGL